MGAAEGRMRNRIETGEGTVKALNFGARERLGECVSDHASTLAVDEAKRFVMDHLLTEPVIARVEVLYARSGSGRVSHLDAGGVVLEHGRGVDLGEAQVGKENADTESTTRSVEGGEVLGVCSACGDSGLAPTDVVDAGASEERAVSGSGPTVVEASAIVGEEVAVDVVAEGLAGAFVLDASVRSSGEPAEGIR
jgi:hypothetical protein